MAIYDCFQYFNEEHIVDLRFNILNKYVEQSPDIPEELAPPKPKQYDHLYGANQNPLKIDLKAIQNLIIFLIGCWIGFQRILVPTWHQLGTQNLPK